MPQWKKYLRKFWMDLTAKLALGEVTHPKDSFDRPLPETAHEIMEELVDICGWSVLAYARIEKMFPVLERVERDYEAYEKLRRGPCSNGIPGEENSATETANQDVACPNRE